MAWRLAGFDPLAHLGSGSTGAVVKARDWTSGQPVAIRYLSKEVAKAPGFADQFRGDAAVLVRIDNPHVAQVYGYIEEPQGAAVVTEFIDGLPLRVILDNGGALEPAAAMYVLKGALTGLSQAHKRSVPHRDFKPENLIIDKDGVTKVVDFGVAVRYRRKAPAAGNPRYMAPELWVGRPATPASDVFAASAVLFEALTGAWPKSSSGDFLGKEGLSASDTSVTGPIAELPERVQALITKGLSAQPSTRFATASDMLDTLELAALAAYGTDWETAGRTELIGRMLPLYSTRPAGISPARRVTGAFARAASSINRGAAIGLLATLVIAAAVVYVVSSGTFDQAAVSQPLAPPISHTPVPQIGPIVPSVAPSSAGPTPDRTKPQRPNGLHVTGRSQTAVSLDWNPSTDNVKVVGYAINRNNRRVGTSYTPGYTDSALTADTAYQYSVIAFDAAANLSPASVTVTAQTLQAPDTEAPSIPNGLHAVGGAGTTSVVLDWNPSSDNVGVAGYDVFRNGSKIVSVTRSGFTDTGLTPNTVYTYAVRAYDTTNNASHNSGTITVRTAITPDKTPPTAPSGLTVISKSTTEIDIAWSPSTDNRGVAGYKVISDGATQPLQTGTSFADTGLSPSTSHTFRVVAVDSSQNTSSSSSTLTVSTDTPPTPQLVTKVALVHSGLVRNMHHPGDRDGDRPGWAAVGRCQLQRCGRPPRKP